MNDVITIAAVALLAFALGALPARNYYKDKEHERLLHEIIRALTGRDTGTGPRP
jgi:hypothetical protein